MKVNTRLERTSRACLYAFVFFVAMFFTFIYVSDLPYRQKVIWILLFGIYAVCYALARILVWKGRVEETITIRHDTIESLALLSERGSILREWNLTNKSGIVIGKNSSEASVDIDLSEIPDAPYISKSHAVLNYAFEHWYIEDLDSKNGIYVKKMGKQSKNIKGSGPVLLDRGDLFYISNTAFVLR